MPLASSRVLKSSSRKPWRELQQLSPLECRWRSALPNRARICHAQLSEAIHIAPEFGEDLSPDRLDSDLASLLGNPVFKRWRADVLNKERFSYER